MRLTPTVRSPAPGSVRAAIWCIVVVVAIGITSATLIFLDRPQASQVLLILLGQTITVVVPGILTVWLARGRNWARWSYLVLTAIGVALRASGLADTLSSGITVNGGFQASSILLSLSAAMLLCSATSNRHFRA